MKKTVILLLSSLVLATSCTTVYDAKLMQGYYDMRMDSKSELEVKSKVRIFSSEKDIRGEYDVISYNQYKPFYVPLFMSYKKTVSKKLYEKAAEKAYDQGGNGVIINSGGLYTVISLHQWDSDNAKLLSYKSAVLDTTLMDRFNKGYIASLSKREIRRNVNDLENEIKFNIKTTKTSEEAYALGRKIEALKVWNDSQEKPSKKMQKRIEDYQKKQVKLAKKTAKKEAKMKKKEEEQKAKEAASQK